MRPSCFVSAFLASAVLSLCVSASAQVENTDYARDPNQPVDQQYTKKILEYTTDPSFISPLVNYLPASANVPTPEKVLGDVAGAPNMLPYAEDVYKYFRLLAASTPRVQVVTIGHSEEGREMIAVAIADESLLKGRRKITSVSLSSPTRARSGWMTPRHSH